MWRGLLPYTRGRGGGPRHADLDSEDSHVDPQKLPLIVMVVLLPNLDGLMVAGGSDAGNEGALNLIARAPEEG